MASMNYCFTVCRAAEEKSQQKFGSTASSAVDIPASSSPGIGAYFFGRFFSFGLSPPISNPFIVKASQSNHIDDNLT
jgi:hypothetical protein